MHVHPDGRRAITEYEILQSTTSNHHRRFTKVKINLITGRTHQIRAHFHHLKCPVVGDDLYYDVDEKIKKYGLLLLAKEIEFIHPETNKNIKVSIEEPERFKEFEKKCKHY
jgi:23S rRNA pseudouridine1911/1915/1917 synthase